MIDQPSPVEWSHVGIWFGCLMAVLVSVKVSLSIWKDHLRKPDPVPPLHHQFASRKDHDALSSQLAEHARRTDERFSAMSRASSESREKIYNSQNKMREDLSALRERTESQTARICAMDAKVDRLISMQIKTQG